MALSVRYLCSYTLRAYHSEGMYATRHKMAPLSLFDNFDNC